MDSPDHNIPMPLATSSPPTVQESPFFNYLRSLSPIQSVKEARYVQRFSQANFSIPPPVFTSPRIHLQSDTSLFKREEEMDAAGSGIYGQGGDTHLKNDLVHCFQKEDQCCNPSGCIDEYLADPGDMEHTTNSSDLCAQRDNNTTVILESSFTSHEDIIAIPNDHVESDVFLDPFSGEQHHDQFVPQAADGQDNQAGDVYQSLQSVGPYKDSDESSRSASRGSVKEADQHQRGIRRHLQFEVAMACKHAGSETHDHLNSSLPEGLTNIGSLVPHHVEPSGISSFWQEGSHGQAVTFMSSFCLNQSFRSAQNYRNRDVSASIPSGLGLPSSSIRSSESMCSVSRARKMLAGNVNAQEEKQMLNRNPSSEKDLESISISSIAREMHPNAQEDEQNLNRNPSSEKDLESISISSVAREMYPNVEDDQQENGTAALIVVPYEGRKLTSQNSDMVEELYQESPKRNSKRAKHANESDGCKRCNCKRSQCLKLYCECFAAGVYCLDSCACENCFNKPEYEDTVQDTRQKIEARNPLAFAPKVVKNAMNSPANMLEEGNWTTPSSARHKRGCNCKKSKCLKKYCECYQAGVGCSSGCRCEGCNNSFGKKAEPIYRRAEKWETPSSEKLDMLGTPDDFLRAGRAHHFSSTLEELADLAHLTPLSLHYSGVATSATLYIGDSSKVSPAQAHQESNLHSSAGCHHYHHSPSNPTPKAYGRKALSELSSDKLLYDILKEDDTPDMLKITFTPTKAVKGSSPNQKRISPPQIRSQELRSSSLQGLRSGRKFILPAVPPFPPLTPHNKSNDEIQQVDGDNNTSSQ